MLGSQVLLKKQRKYSQLMEPKISLPCSQQPVTGPYTKPIESTPHPQTLLCSDVPTLILSSTYTWISRWSLSLGFFYNNFALRVYLPPCDIRNFYSIYVFFPDYAVSQSSSVDIVTELHNAQTVI